MAPLTPITDIDYLVLTCASVEATTDWYARYLGIRPAAFMSAALHFGARRLNLHQRGREPEPHARAALPGSTDLCFLLDASADLDAVVRGFRRAGVDVLEGSFYVRDPDGNLVE